MTRRQQDLDLWKKWHRTQRKTDLQALLHNLDPIIQTQVNKWSGTLARPMLESRARVLTVNALQGFDPNRGTAPATHVTNQLQKLSRTVYAHTQAIRLPEHKSVSMASFAAGFDMLRDQLGRDPTMVELADHLGWTPHRTTEFQKAYDRKELLSSGEFKPSAFPVADDYDPMVEFVYHDLAPQEQRLFEHTTGYGGKAILKNEQLMQKLKMTQGQLSYQKRKLVNKFQAAQR
jgi:hypothetical protein